MDVARVDVAENFVAILAAMIGVVQRALQTGDEIVLGVVVVAPVHCHRLRLRGVSIATDECFAVIAAIAPSEPLGRVAEHARMSVVVVGSLLVASGEKCVVVDVIVAIFASLVDWATNRIDAETDPCDGKRWVMRVWRQRPDSWGATKELLAMCAGEAFWVEDSVSIGATVLVVGIAVPIARPASLDKWLSVDAWPQRCGARPKGLKSVRLWGLWGSFLDYSYL